MTAMPSESNRYLCEHAALLIDSFRRLTGGDLVPPGLAPNEAARQLFEAPFAIVSHDAAPDPVFTYGNRTALRLFEMSWSDFTALPSRHSAEAPRRQERERLLREVARRGFVDDYGGVRISAGGRRFRIEGATVWNLVDAQGRLCGQAATFADWTFLDGDE